MTAKTRYQKIVRSYGHFCAWHNVYTVADNSYQDFDEAKRIYMAHARTIFKHMQTYKQKQVIKFDNGGFIALDFEGNYSKYADIDGVLVIRYIYHDKPRLHLIGIKDGELQEAPSKITQVARDVLDIMELEMLLKS